MSSLPAIPEHIVGGEVGAEIVVRCHAPRFVATIVAPDKALPEGTDFIRYGQQNTYVLAVLEWWDTRPTDKPRGYDLLLRALAAVVEHRTSAAPTLQPPSNDEWEWEAEVRGTVEGMTVNGQAVVVPVGKYMVRMSPDRRDAILTAKGPRANLHIDTYVLSPEQQLQYIAQEGTISIDENFPHSPPAR